MNLHPLPALPTPPALPVPVPQAKRSMALTRPYAAGDRRGAAGAVAPDSTARATTTLRPTNAPTGSTSIDVNAPYVPGSLVDIIA